MEIKIRAVTGAKKERIIKEEKGYKVYVSAPPEKGKANQRIIEVVASLFSVKKNQVKIVKGLKSKIKSISINL